MEAVSLACTPDESMRQREILRGAASVVESVHAFFAEHGSMQQCLALLERMAVFSVDIGDWSGEHFEDTV